MKLDALTAAVILSIAGLIGVAAQVEYAGWVLFVGLLGYMMA